MPHRVITAPVFITAVAPALATITMEQFNHALAAVNGIVGLAYLIWRIRRDSRRKKS